MNRTHDIVIIFKTVFLWQCDNCHAFYIYLFYIYLHNPYNVFLQAIGFSSARPRKKLLLNGLSTSGRKSGMNVHYPLSIALCQLKNFSYLCEVNPPSPSLSIPTYVPRRCMFDRGGLCARQQRCALKAYHLLDKVVSNNPIFETR